jgi:hypothetical protein
MRSAASAAADAAGISNGAGSVAMIGFTTSTWLGMMMGMAGLAFGAGYVVV